MTAPLPAGLAESVEKICARYPDRPDGSFYAGIVVQKVARETLALCAEAWGEQPAQREQTRKPFRLNITKEQCLRLADLEGNSVIGAGVPTAEDVLLNEIAHINKWADGFDAAAMKERKAGEQYQKELRAKITEQAARIEALERLLVEAITEIEPLAIYGDWCCRPRKLDVAAPHDESCIVSRARAELKPVQS